MPTDAIVAQSSQSYRLTLEDPTTAVAVAEATLVFGGVPRFALAKQEASDGGAVRMCSATLGFDGLFHDSTHRVEVLNWQRDGEYELLGDGWYRRGADDLLWTTNSAELLLPFWRIGSLRVSVEASTPDWVPDGELGTVSLRMNGREFSRQPLSRGWALYEWDVPRTALREGLNQVYLTVSSVHQQPEGLGPTLGIGVREVRLSLD